MKIYVAVPCMDTIDTDFASALVSMHPVGDTSVHFHKSSLVYDSRNNLAQDAINDGSDYILWLDSDMVFTPDLLERLVADMTPERDMVCGLFFARRPNFDPCVWTKLRLGLGDDAIHERPTEIPKDIFEIDACGMAATLVRTNVVADILNRSGNLFAPIIGYGEDISFCIRARRLGYRLWCDPDIKVGHVSRTTVTEETWKAWNSRTGDTDDTN